MVLDENQLNQMINSKTNLNDIKNPFVEQINETEWLKDQEGKEYRIGDNNELIYKLRDHSIFTCYAPYDKPKFALTVIAEHMGSGSKVAAPIAKNIMELALKKFI